MAIRLTITEMMYKILGVNRKKNNNKKLNAESKEENEKDSIQYHLSNYVIMWHML